VAPVGQIRKEIGGGQFPQFAGHPLGDGHCPLPGGGQLPGEHGQQQAQDDAGHGDERRLVYAKPVLEACQRAHCHGPRMTGDFDVFERQK
jgi:hypothetical protein